MMDSVIAQLIGAFFLEYLKLLPERNLLQMNKLNILYKVSAWAWKHRSFWANV